MPFSVVVLLALLLFSPALFYLSLSVIRRLDFRHQALDLGKLTVDECRFVWRIAGNCLPRNARLSLFTNLNSLCSVLTQLEQFRNRHPGEKTFCAAVEAKLYRRCAELDRVRLPSYHHPYSHTQELPVGLEVELFFKASRGNGYSAQILEQDKNGMIISYPYSTFGKGPTNWRGEPVLLCFSHREAGTYRFASEFDRNYFDRHFTSLRILHSNSFVLLQKRQMQRHKVHLRAWADLSPRMTGRGKTVSLYSGGRVPLGDRAMVPCTIVDISSEGLRITFQEKVYCHHIIVVHLSLLGSRIVITGRICSTHHFEPGHTGVGLNFQSLTSEDRQRLYSFLYGPRRAESLDKTAAVAG